MNPIALQMLEMIKNGANPQQLVLQYLTQQMGNNPMGQNLLQLAQQGNTAQIEKVARNLMQAKGLDYDKEFNAFCKMIGR